MSLFITCGCTLIETLTLRDSCFLIAAGLYILVGLPLAWLPNNCPRYGKRATANGLQLTIGNASGIMAPFI